MTRGILSLEVDGLCVKNGLLSLECLAVEFHPNVGEALDPTILSLHGSTCSYVNVPSVTAFLSSFHPELLPWRATSVVYDSTLLREPHLQTLDLDMWD